MAKTKLEPMGDYLLIADMPRTTTIDGIDLPENVRQQEMCFGYVIAVGPACLSVKEQNRVCYGPYAGKSVIIEGVEFRLLREGQIEGRVVDID